MTVPVRLVVDAARCDGHGICALKCPELITLDRWGFAGVEGSAVEGRRTVRRARRAAAACPAQALSLVAVSERARPGHPDPVPGPTGTKTAVGRRRRRA
jgi:ferredoxin